MAPRKYPREFIDSLSYLRFMVDNLVPCNPLFIDLEGTNPNRTSAISIFQLYDPLIELVYLIDVKKLGEETFSTAGEKNQTLRQLLEAPDTPKVFFDVRNDSHALFQGFRINLAGVQDVQLMEFATRKRGSDSTHVNGLANCVKHSLVISAEEKALFTKQKDGGRRLFSPEKGGSSAALDIRPLPEEIEEYCVQDAWILERLWSGYKLILSPRQRQKIDEFSMERVRQSQQPEYDPNATGKTEAPQGLISLRTR